MYFEIENQAREAIKEAIASFDCEIESEIRLDFPPNPDLGDLASTISFDLAKTLRKALELLKSDYSHVKQLHDYLYSELEKLRMLDPGSSEYMVTRNYLDLIVQLPWVIFFVITILLIMMKYLYK